MPTLYKVLELRNLRSQLRGLRARCVPCREGCVRELACLLRGVLRTNGDFLRAVAGIGSTRLTTFND